MKNSTRKNKISTSIFAALIVCGVFLMLLNMFVSLKVFSNNYSEIYGHARLKNTVIDFNEKKILSSIDINLTGEYEFFYNKWIASDNIECQPDAIVSVPHHWTGMSIDGKKIDKTGYASYRFYMKNVPIGSQFQVFAENDIGAFNIYANGKLITTYGEHTKTGNGKSNGLETVYSNYLVEDENPIEIVFEVSASEVGGFMLAPRLRFNNNQDFLYWLVRNIGPLFFGIIITLFFISALINITALKEEKNWSFTLLLGIICLQFFFSIDYFWRFCELFNLYIFNSIMNVNVLINCLLAIALYVHFSKIGYIKFNNSSFIILTTAFTLSAIAYFLLMGTNYAFIPIVLQILMLSSFHFSISKILLKGSREAIFYLVLTLFTALAMLVTAMHYLKVIRFGLECFTSIGLFINSIMLLGLLWTEMRKKTLKIIQLMLVEKDINNVKAEALKSQIKPHFIFNSLTNIQNIYNRSVKEGNEALTRFSKHLRINVEAEGTDLVTFSKELENILNYVELENLRRQEKINFLLDCEEYNFLVPILSLQPFLENAFKYSEVDKKVDGFVEIKSYRTQNGCAVEINDNGKGFDITKINQGSTGLKNAKQRLMLISKAVVKIDSQINAGTKITIQFSEDSLCKS